LLNYEKNNRNIKIEISKRKTPEAEYVFANFYGTDVKILKINDSFSTKLLACTTRNKIAYRDFYDVYFYLKKGIIPNEKIIKNITGKNLKSYLIYLVNFIKKNIINRSVFHGVGELVNEKQKYWIKPNLKKDLINRLNFLINQLNQ